MSRKEIMDETKNAEGDPHMKQERRQRAQAIASAQMSAEVAKADVIMMLISNVLIYFIVVLFCFLISYIIMKE